MIEYREKNKDKIDKTRKRHYKENRQLHRDRSQHYNSSLAGRFVGWRSSAKSRGIDWELTYDDVIAMPMICFYTNRQLTLEVDKLNTMSLDRIDNSKGYTKENTVPCCYYVNIMKNKFDAKQFLELCAAVAENQTKILKRL